MLLQQLRLVVRRSEEGRAQDQLVGDATAAQQAPQGSFVVTLVRFAQQQIGRPADEQREDDRATDDDQWAE
ncbi:hypothetical protein [Streptomyces sp. MNU76]|uniref:hypothetical protein n=1 Tax=Streptomyces sp. MNU76 TaxID=2560026 RepID=UPI0035A8F039